MTCDCYQSGDLAHAGDCPVRPEATPFVTPCWCGEGYEVPWPDHNQCCPWFITEGKTPPAQTAGNAIKTQNARKPTPDA